MTVYKSWSCVVPFETTDRDILSDRLRHWVGETGASLDWSSSYLTKGKFFVSVNNFMSSLFHLKYGVPHGSILASNLLIL